MRRAFVVIAYAALLASVCHAFVQFVVLTDVYTNGVIR